VDKRSAIHQKTDFLYRRLVDYGATEALRKIEL
jgi:hypothetical protein